MYPTLPTAVEAYRAWAARHPAEVANGEEVPPHAAGRLSALRRFARSLNPRRDEAESSS